MKAVIEFFHRLVRISRGLLLVKSAKVLDPTGNWLNLIPEMIFILRHVSFLISFIIFSDYWNRTAEMKHAKMYDALRDPCLKGKFFWIQNFEGKGSIFNF